MCERGDLLLVPFPFTDLLPDNHPGVAPEQVFLQITALREAEPAVT